MTTVFVYVNAARQVGDAEHIKIFASGEVAERGSNRMTPSAWHSSTI